MILPCRKQGGMKLGHSYRLLHLAMIVSSGLSSPKLKASGQTCRDAVFISLASSTFECRRACDEAAASDGDRSPFQKSCRVFVWLPSKQWCYASRECKETVPSLVDASAEIYHLEESDVGTCEQFHDAGLFERPAKDFSKILDAEAVQPGGRLSAEATRRARNARGHI